MNLIGFSDLNNVFRVVTELTYKNGDDEFLPDITLLDNGLPLAFIEVKIPNNRHGVLAERKRIEVRSRNSRFRRFVNITQLMVFSNNMEYDDASPEPIAGAFYAAPAYLKPIFNYFREEEQLDLGTLLTDIDDGAENLVLGDNNLASIKRSPEFLTNKNPTSPTKQCHVLRRLAHVGNALGRIVRPAITRRHRTLDETSGLASLRD